MSVKPIRPEEVGQLKADAIPDEVIEIWNKLIVEKTRNGYAKIIQKDAVTRICSELGVPRDHVFDSGWLDVEDVYREAGWEVTYDKPAYNESYDAYFVFTMPRTK